MMNSAWEIILEKRVIGTCQIRVWETWGWHLGLARYYPSFAWCVGVKNHIWPRILVRVPRCSDLPSSLGPAASSLRITLVHRGVCGRALGETFHRRCYVCSFSALLSSLLAYNWWTDLGSRRPGLRVPLLPTQVGPQPACFSSSVSEGTKWRGTWSPE